MPWLRRSRGMAVYSAEMSRARGSACPDANVLAGYVDRQLSDDRNAELEAHLASCDSCTELIAEALSVGESVAPRVTFTDEPAAGAGGWTRRIVRGGAAAAAIVAALILPELAGSRRDTKLADLAVAAGTRWPVEGRLTGGIPHSSLNAPLAGGQGGAVGDPVRVQLVAGKIREDLDKRGTPEQLHAFGLSQLLLGQLDAASVALTAAAREQPLNAAYQSDAAALYLERARAGLHPDDLPRALAAAERARLANPSALEGAFNRALALDRLSLTAQARQAWTEYLARDSSSSWSSEARSHLEALDRPGAATRWPAIESRLRQGVSAGLAEDAVRVHMTGARNFLESELLPAWAAAAERGEGSAERESLRSLAAAFARIAGDDLYVDVVSSIDRAESQGESAVRRLAAAHRAYAAAAAIYLEDRFADAAAGLTAARAALSASGSPFAARVDLDLAVVDFYGGRAEEATRGIAALRRLAERDRFAYLAARGAWLQGLVSFAQGRYGDVREAWETTLAAFEEMGDAEQVAAAHGLLANLHFSLGDSARAWEHRSHAMRALVAPASPRLRHALLTSAAGQALRENLPEAALILQNEVVGNALATNRPAVIADALIQRAAISLALNRVSEARTDLRATRDQLKSISEAVLKGRRESAVLALESDLVRPGNAAEASQLAARAIELAEATKDRTRLAGLWLRRAKAEMAAGLPGAADRSTEQGIEAFMQERALLAQAGGLSRVDEAWELFEVAMRSALARGDTSKAFAFASAARNRDPLSALQANSLAAAVRAQLAPGEAVIALNQLDDELFVWLVTPASVDLVRRPVKRPEAIRLVARHRDEIDLEVQRPKASAALFNELVRSLTDRLKNVEHLIVVPDAPYYSVAFSALWDRDRDRFVVEDRSVSVLSDVGSLLKLPATPMAPSRAAFVDVALPSTADAAFAVWSSAPDRAVVRVAAPVRANNEYPGLSSVMFADAPGRRYSGLVLTREIAARDLSRLGLVILPDCTAGSDLDEGQGTLGAAAAFLAAGVPSVVATMWPIGESARTELFAGFDRQLRINPSAAAALRALQRNVLRSNGRRLGAWTGLVAYGVGR